jgi:hypothetical protein
MCCQLSHAVMPTTARDDLQQRSGFWFLLSSYFCLACPFPQTVCILFGCQPGNCVCCAVHAVFLHTKLLLDSSAAACAHLSIGLLAVFPAGSGLQGKP